jgi:hypothetical protein
MSLLTFDTPTTSPAAGDAASLEIDLPRSYAKRLANVTARLALQGCELYQLSDGTLLATRVNMTRPLPTIAAAERFVALMEGAV